MEEARDARGISVAALARRASIDRKRLWYILDGQQQMRADEFVRVCAVLNLGLRSFLTPAIVDEMRQSRLGGATIRATIGAPKMRFRRCIGMPPMNP